MKRISCLLLLSIFLASCANAVSATSTKTFEVLKISKVSTSMAPTEAPTEVTKDPNMPPGATGKDSDGNWIKEVNGITWTEIDVRYGEAPESHFSEWTRVAGQVFSIDSGEWSAPESVSLMKLILTDNNEQPGQYLYVEHPDPTSTHVTNDQKNNSFSGRYFYDLAKALRVPKSGFYDFYTKLKQGDVHIYITTPDGVKHDINPGGIYTVIQIPFDQATGIEFNEYPDEEDPTLIYRIALTSDKDNNLIIIEAVPDITKLNDRERARFVYAGLYQAIAYANQAIPSRKDGAAKHFVPLVENGTNHAIEDTYGSPHVVFITK